MLGKAENLCFNLVMLYLGADHNGFGLKKEIIKFLSVCCIDYKDMGALEYDTADDYPPYAILVAKQVANKPGSFGVLICGTGVGVTVVANKIKGIRASFGFSESVVKQGREKDDINVLTFAGYTQKGDEVERMIKVFLETPFSHLPRHQRRLDQITALELEGG